MKKLIFFTVLSLMLTSSSLAKRADPLCVIDPDKMPESWRPPAELVKNLNPAPWSASEAKDVKLAMQTGLNEIIDYFKKKPVAIQTLWDDSIEALIQITHASANAPEFDTKARSAARKNLTTLITPYIKLNPRWALCDEFDHLLPLAIFAHRLYPTKDKLKAVVTTRTNAAFKACGSLEAAMGNDFQKILANKGAKQQNIEDLFDLTLWALWFIEAELYPDIKLPNKTRTFGQKVWNYLMTYKFHDASEFKQGTRDEKFIKIAYLATHIAYIPSGSHRFPLYIGDKPELYRFHRQNYYQVLQLGKLDLFASFVESLRQYGCTASNDLQVRDGTRYLLQTFHNNNKRWMNYREKGEKKSKLDGYALVRLPWKAMSGLRFRQIEQPKTGTYGGIVRQWLPNAQ